MNRLFQILQVVVLGLVLLFLPSFARGFAANSDPHVISTSVPFQNTTTAILTLTNSVFLPSVASNATWIFLPRLVNITAIANGDSYSPVASADGAVVAFGSDASNLVTGDTNGVADVFVWQDNTIRRISVTISGAQATGDSSSPQISQDGRYVVFDSAADNLVVGDANNARDVFRYDLETNTIALMSATLEGIPGNGESVAPQISSDGNIVAFQTNASNIGWREGIIIKNITADVVTTVPYEGAYNLSLSSEGDTILFERNDYVYCYPTETGTHCDYAPVFFRASVPLWEVEAIKSSLYFFGNGSRYGYSRIESPLVSPDGNSYIHYIDQQSNDEERFSLSCGLRLVSGKTEIVVDNFAFTSDDPKPEGPFPGDCNRIRLALPQATMSQDATRVAFGVADLNQPSMTPTIMTDTNAATDIYVLDVATNTYELISKPLGGETLSDGHSDQPFITADGNTVVFRSAATNLTSEQDNGLKDIFIYRQ